MKNLQQLINRAISELLDLNITPGKIIEINTLKGYSRWGNCTYKRKMDGYCIKINQCLLEDNVSDEATMNTVMHEVIHTVKGCLNHKTNFKKVAALVNNRYGYNIKRVTSAEEKDIIIPETNKKVNYIIKCNNCGNESLYIRKTKAVKSIMNYEYKYRCGCCNSDELYIK